MGRAQARVARVDEYLNAQKRAHPHLRVVEGGRADPAFNAVAEPPPVRSLRPDWLPADLEAPAEQPPPRRERTEPAASARRTLVVTGRPQDDLRFESYGKQKRHRRSPTAARLAGRPDRVAGWAVALGVAMALMAVATGGSGPSTAAGEAAPQPPALTR